MSLFFRKFFVFFRIILFSFFRKIFLCVLHSLLDTEADSLSLCIDIENLGFHCLSYFEFFGYVRNPLVSHFGYMNQSVKTRLEFYKSAVLFDLYHLTVHYLSYFVIFVNYGPRFRSGLLETQ